MNGPRSAWLAAALALATPAAAHADASHEIAALKAEVEHLAARVAELEARLAERDSEPTAAADGGASEPAADAAAAAPPAAAAVPTGRARATVGGRIKLDALLNHTSGGGATDDTRLIPGSIPLEDTGEGDQVTFSARASRLWIKSWTPTPFGDAGAYLEFDLFGRDGTESVSNSHGLRLRHGYAELGPVLFGQTYSTFVNVAAFPEHNDDGITAGGLNVRQPQIRFTAPLGAGHAGIALESPETTLRARSGARLAPDDDRLPDLVLRYDRDGAWGGWSLAALVREIRIDGPAGDDAAVGVAAHAAGRVALGRNDQLRFTLVGGNALGRYLSFNAFDAGRLDARGRIELTPAAGGYLSWRHLWTARWRSNLTAGYAWQDDDGALGAENASLHTVHANVLWSPVPTTTMGLEWIYAYRRLFDHRTGALQRLQFSAVHKF